MSVAIRLLLFAVSLAALGRAGAADPLPAGAKTRMGSPLLRDANNWSGGTLAPDGKHLLLVSQRGIARYDLATGEPAGSLSEKAGGFSRQIKFNSDASRILSINYSDVAVWDAASGKTLAAVKRNIPYGDAAACLTSDGKVFAVGANQDFNTKDKPISVLVWDVEKNAKLAEVAVLQNQQAMVAIAPDGKTFATWGSHFERNPPKDAPDPANDPNRILQLWETATGKELARVRSEGYGSATIAYAPDGLSFALSTGNGLIRIVDAKTGAERRRLFARADQGTRLVYAPDGSRLATAGTDGTIQLWNAADGTRIATIECPLGSIGYGVRGISFTAPDRAVCWTAIGAAAIAWEVPSGKLLTPFSGHVAAVRSVAFAKDGKELLTGGDDGQIFRWEPSGKLLGDVRLRNSGTFNGFSRFPMVPVALAPDGTMATCSLSLQACYEVPSGRQIAAPLAGLGLESRTFICSDARTFLAVPALPYPPKPQLKSMAIQAWDITSGAKIAEFEVAPCELLRAEVSPDRSRLVTITLVRNENKSEFHVIGWELKTGKKLGEYMEPGGFGSTFLAIAPDNASVVVACPSGKLAAIGLADGKVFKEFDTTRRAITAHPAFVPGGKQLAVALQVGFGNAAAGEIVLFDWDSSKPGGKFRNPTGSLTSLAFTADGKTLASGSADTTILLWDVSAAAP